MKLSGRQIQIKKLLSLLLMSGLLVSCQKEINGSSDPSIIVPVPTNQKPKVGTIWTYRYYTFYAFGGSGLATSDVLKLVAKNEEVYGGDKYLNIVNQATDTTVFLLGAKPDGLYRYDKISGTGSLFCKAPAAVNDTYTSTILGAPENFIVKNVQDSFPTGIGTVLANYYEGSKTGNLVDEVWYNENIWIALHKVHRFYELNHTYYRYSTLALDNIAY